MNQDINYKTELLKNKAISFVPGGNSMWPIIKHKKQSVIVVLKEARLSKYDVALYVRNNKTFVLHRVLDVVDGGYVICGDSQTQLENVKEEQVFGVLAGYYKGKKYIDVSDPKYIKRVKKWYNNKFRKLILMFFYKFIYIRSVIKKKLFRIKVNEDE